jgi:hypothetical protein
MRLQFNSVGNDEEEPVKQDNPIRLPTPPMLIELHSKYHTQRGKRGDGGPESEIGIEGLALSLGMQSWFKGSDEDQTSENDLLKFEGT